MRSESGSIACRASPRRGARARDGVFRIAFRSDPSAIRTVLSRLAPVLAPWGFDDEARARAQIVLAEVFNNIAEHAYDEVPGRIELDLHAAEGLLRVTVSDAGRPMPGGCPPSPQAPPDPAGLPEGGFGWFLIRSYARDLSYRREAARNVLDFTLHRAERKDG